MRALSQCLASKRRKRAFDEEGKHLLEFAARELERVERVCKVVDNLMKHSENFSAQLFFFGT